MSITFNEEPSVFLSKDSYWNASNWHLRSLAWYELVVQSLTSMKTDLCQLFLTGYLERLYMSSTNDLCVKEAKVKDLDLTSLKQEIHLRI